MDRDAAATLEFRKAAVRIVAAAEYFKAAGDLPPWARAELDLWKHDAERQGKRGPDLTAPS